MVSSRAADRDWDIAIVGAGMVGISVGLLLAARLAPETRILLLEEFSLAPPEEDAAKRYSPSFDSRSTALSESSCQIYRELGLWPTLARRSSPIHSIHVSERGRFGSTLLQARDYDWDALGQVVENAWLGSTLLQHLHQGRRLVLRSPARVTAVLAQRGGYRLRLERGAPLHTRLLVVADGAQSRLREALGIQAQRRPYHQYALVGNVAHAGGHEGCAYERFTAEGVLAMLPLLDDEAGCPRSALVWTLPEALAKARQECPQAEFLRQLQDSFGYRLGRLHRVGERVCYPLALVQAEEPVRQGLVLLGNAAHSLHPVAGQGFNLALRSAEVLAEVLADGQRRGEPLADLGLLQDYVRRQQRDLSRTRAFTDQLPQLFGLRGAAPRGLRDLGLVLLDLSPVLKHQLVQRAAGVAARRESAGERS